jgi:hypothetical protein
MAGGAPVAVKRRAVNASILLKNTLYLPTFYPDHICSEPLEM